RAALGQASLRDKKWRGRPKLLRAEFGEARGERRMKSGAAAPPEFPGNKAQSRRGLAARLCGEIGKKFAHGSVAFGCSPVPLGTDEPQGSGQVLAARRRIKVNGAGPLPPSTMPREAAERAPGRRRVNPANGPSGLH